MFNVFVNLTSAYSQAVKYEAADFLAGMIPILN